jgi:hypothetical protein
LPKKKKNSLRTENNAATIEHNSAAICENSPSVSLYGRFRDDSEQLKMSGRNRRKQCSGEFSLGTPPATTGPSRSLKNHGNRPNENCSATPSLRYTEVEQVLISSGSCRAAVDSPKSVQLWRMPETHAYYYDVCVGRPAEASGARSSDSGISRIVRLSIFDFVAVVQNGVLGRIVRTSHKGRVQNRSKADSQGSRGAVCHNKTVISS